MKLLKEMTTVFDVLCEGILIIDADARIIYGNKAYCDFLKLEPSQITGKLLRDVRPGARLPNVLKTGKAILNAPRQEIEDIYFVNMYPIFQEGAIIGGISVVTFIQQAYDVQKMLQEVERSKQVIRRISKASNAKYTLDDVITVDPLSIKTKALAQRAAGTDATVLLQSESGTGKELYAQGIHNASARRGDIFLAINCANFNANILESELFGYVEGAFTGARKGGKIGLFEAASNGTIFLDEISEMDISLQAKLLRVLQEQRIRPVGGMEERAVNVRVIAACNVELLQYISDGKFRNDLYYRLNTFPILIPPLRERKGDIEPLIQCFLDELSRKQRRNLCVDENALQRLYDYDWPGNVRELRNVLEFVSYFSDDGMIRESLLPDTIPPKRLGELESLAQRVRRFEQNEINRLLQKHGTHLNGKRKTAAELGISLASLYNKLENK